MLFAVAAQGAAAEPDFTVEPNPPTAGKLATYTAVGTETTDTVTWDFGELVAKTGPEVTHTFATPGAKQVSMTVTKGLLDPDVLEPPLPVTVTKTVQVNAVPAGAITYAPKPPIAGDVTLFAATHQDPDNADLQYSWDFGDGSSGTGDSPSHEYASAGTKTVKLTVSDGRGGIDTDQVQVDVQPAPPPPPPGPPQVGFAYLPSSPFTGETVEFVSTARPVQGESITSYRWDFDGDLDFNDATGESVSTKAPARAETWVVRHKVVQSGGASATAQRSITVRAVTPMPPPPPPPAPPANKPPAATFAFAPQMPLTGDLVEFLSGSTDPDGQITGQVWDLDGDNQFDDAAGARVSWRYATAGARRVRIQVTDNRGLSRVQEQIVTVGARPVAARFLIPFPVIRLTGRVYRSYTQVKSLAVRAPRGARATVTCRGRGCPRRSQSKRLGKSRRVSFTSFKGRLRPGTQLSVAVKRTGYVGKYTRFRMRAGAEPARLDLCLVSSPTKPRRCPTR